MFTLSRKVVRRITAVALSASVALLSALWWPPEKTPTWLDPIIHSWQRVEWFGYDTLFHWRGAQPDQIDPRIAIVGYSRATELAMVPGQRIEWPPPRAYHARLVDNLVKDGAKVIAFDVLMSEPSRQKEGVKDDQAFDAALNRAGRCILACRIDRQRSQGGGFGESRKSMIDPYHDDALGIDFERNATEALVDIPLDEDGVVRRILPLQKFQGEWIPSLSAAAFLKLTGGKIEESRMTPHYIYLGGRPIPRTGPTVIDQIDPENTVGTSYIDFPAGSLTFPLFRYEDVYNGTFPPGTFRGRAVFVGVSGLELAQVQQDKFTTAYSHFTPESDGSAVTREVYGVVVQGQMLNALLLDNFISHAPPWLTFLIVCATSLIANFAVRNSLTWRGPVLLILALVGYLALVFAVFIVERMYIPWILPGALLLTSTAAIAWFERGQMKKMWAGYVSPAYMEVMLRDGVEAKPRRHEATVIFGDIRGFTNFSEHHSPERVVTLLNKHLDKLIQILFSEDGTIDKFLGDGIMAVFGAPVMKKDAAVRAVRACWKMRQAALEAVTDEKGNPHVLATGFGVTTGALVSCHVGSRTSNLSTFTLIGGTVNLAARLQAVTGQPDVIIDEATYNKVREHVSVEFLGNKDLKGIEHPVACYKVTEWKD